MKTIRDVMRADPFSITPAQPLHDALELLIENNISGLPVVDESGRLLGVLSEKDLLKILYEPGVHDVQSVMTHNPVSFDIDTELVDVVDCLMANDFRRVFIERDEKLVGMISRADLMPAILETLLERC